MASSAESGVNATKQRGCGTPAAASTDGGLDLVAAGERHVIVVDAGDPRVGEDPQREEGA